MRFSVLWKAHLAQLLGGEWRRSKTAHPFTKAPTAGVRPHLANAIRPRSRRGPAFSLTEAFWSSSEITKKAIFYSCAGLTAGRPWLASLGTTTLATWRASSPVSSDISLRSRFRTAPRKNFLAESLSSLGNIQGSMPTKPTSSHFSQSHPSLTIARV
jgi:hypothetical protein